MAYQLFGRINNKKTYLLLKKKYIDNRICGNCYKITFSLQISQNFTRKKDLRSCESTEIFLQKENRNVILFPMNQNLKTVFLKHWQYSNVSKKQTLVF